MTIQPKNRFAPFSSAAWAARWHPDLFAYSAALEGWEGCVGRLRGFIDRRAAGTDFVVVGLSLGTVLLRAALPRLARPRPPFLFRK